MILSVVLPTSTDDARWDAIVDDLHRATPLLALPRKGLAFTGTDDMPLLHRIISAYGARAALAPTRQAAYVAAWNGMPGRIDAYANDHDVPADILEFLPELCLPSHVIDRLRLFGLRTIGHLRGLTERQLAAQFGKDGVAIARLLHAPSLPVPIHVPPPSITVRVGFEAAEREPGCLRHAVDEMIERGIAELRGREAWRVDVSVLDRADTVVARQHRILRSGVSDADRLRVHAHALLQALVHPTRYWWGAQLRLASLRLPVGMQTHLFPAKPSVAALTEAMRPRYGQVLKTVEILNAWTVIPEHYARLRSLG